MSTKAENNLLDAIRKAEDYNKEAWNMGERRQSNIKAI
jgi:hypothetical protein